MSLLPGRHRVLFASEWMPTYLVGFFDALRERLGDREVEVEVVHGDPPREIARRGTASTLAWAQHRPNRLVPVGKRTLVWQPVTAQACRADLVVVDQASRLLLNYWLLARQSRGGARVALWGHGPNLNQPGSSRVAERVKRRISQWPHWWFAYTEGTKERVIGLGYPPERITVTQNAGATDSLRRLLDELDDNSEASLRRELGLGAGPVGLFLGSLYADKRLDYLIAAADQVAAIEPEFRLVIAGDGPGRSAVAAAARSRPHVLWTGYSGGERKAALLRTASALLIPGAVGLAVVDGFAAGLPTISTRVPTHGPEIEYLHDGENGRVLAAAASPGDYAQAVLSVLDDAEELRLGASRSGTVYTTESMVARFAEGIERALAAPPLRGR